MDRRRRASSTASKVLLSRQLASITDTLAKASRRRDAELNKVQWPARASPVTAGPASVSESALLMPVNELDKTCPEPATAQLDATAATTSDLRASKHAAVCVTNFDAPVVSMRACGTSHTRDDPRAILAELRGSRDVVSISDTQNINDEDADVRRMLAEAGRSASPPLMTAVAPMDDDPRQMLAELDMLSVTGHREVSLYSKENKDDEGDDDVSILRTRLQNLRSHFDMSPQMAPGNHACLDKMADRHGQDDIVEETGTCIDPKVMPYIIALELEHSRTQWEHAQRWTTYLYSSGPNSYKAHEEKDIAVAHAEDSLEKIICSVLEVEDGFRRKEEKTKLQKRLIVSNLAAGADVQELERLFRKHRFEIVNIALMPDRDPLRRTQTAYIDMSSREAAIEAAYMTGQMYGLIFHVKLAVEQHS